MTPQPTNDKQGTQAKTRKKLALGRGLDALFPDLDTIDTKHTEYFLCDIDVIRPNPFQPRVTFTEEELAELSQSIQEQGLIQPLLVRKNDTGYELIAGERRLRASKLAGLRQVPVVIRNVTDRQLLEISIVENIQREDLNPLEEADAYQRLMSEFDLTQEQVAQRVGKSRSAVANFLRLIQLPDIIKDSLRKSRISMGHARALLGADSSVQQRAAWQEIVKKKLSVRETENLIRRLRSQKTKKTPPVKETPYYKSIAEDLSRRFGTKVQIRKKGKQGRLEIDFYTDTDLDRLIHLLTGET